MILQSALRFFMDALTFIVSIGSFNSPEEISGY
jgi:hypothetical protein